ncbi:MAG: pyridoxamine 5'-phosphate oxidase family protein [Syntrophales bacterium]|nr:pyridoxamine 5'-phosphate oxidase family protein [Syntrophales bacterium]MDY0044257.1 pyridoxamine 5'-phosphate oxidase family protein [Syntrophales bacterium]
MKPELLKTAVELGNRVGYVFIATSDPEGLPHIAASRKITLEKDNAIGIREWFCPGTLANIQMNPFVSLVAWDSINDTGYQILGKSIHMEDLYMMNGLSAETEQGQQLPQVERKITLMVQKILQFCHAPHTDIEE